jgi:hypothetical protein
MGLMMMMMIPLTFNEMRMEFLKLYYRSPLQTASELVNNYDELVPELNLDGIIHPSLKDGGDATAHRISTSLSLRPPCDRLL